MLEFILMSVQTKYARKIFSGNKKWEFRKFTPNYTPLFPSSIVVYSAGEDQAIIGEFVIKRIIKTNFEELMQITEYSKDPESIEWFKRYYKNVNLCSAIEVGEIFLYDTPLSLRNIKIALPSFRPPQNFIYLSRNPSLWNLVKDYRKKNGEQSNVKQSLFTPSNCIGR